MQKPHVGILPISCLRDPMKQVIRIFSRKQTTIGSAAVVLMVMVFASRILGLFRDRLLAAYFTPEQLGIYFAAFRLPNLLFELLVMGALTTAFIPVFASYISQNKEEEAHAMAATLVNIGSILMLILAIPVLIWAEPISRMFAPGFSDEQIYLMAHFTRFMIVFQVLPLMAGNFFTGILQSYNLFLVPALAPVVYNIGIIIAVVMFAGTLGLYAPVVGVGIGAFLFMFIQLPLLAHVGYRHRMRFDPKTRGVKEVAQLMAPRTFGLAASQIDTTVDLMLATLLGAKMVTIFNFAQHLQQLPVGLFGATIAQAALPSLSVASSKADTKQFKSSIVSAIHQILFFVLPASALFIVLRIPVVRLVFGSSRFDWEATVLTGMTLSAFSISLFAQALTHVLVRAFYALYDSRTPVIISVATILLNSSLSIAFVLLWRFPVWSLGLSTSIASILNAFILLIVLDSKVGRFSKRELLIPPIKMVVAAVLTGIMLYIPLKLLDQLVFDTTRTFNLVLLTGFSGMLGMFTYFFLSWVFGVGEVQSFISLLKKVRRKGIITLEPASQVVDGGTQDQLTQ